MSTIKMNKNERQNTIDFLDLVLYFSPTRTYFAYTRCIIHVLKVTLIRMCRFFCDYFLLFRRLDKRVK